jgi:DinB superfamily
MGAEELMGKFALAVAEARGVIASLPAERLTDRINPQNGEVSVLDAIYQVVGHVQQHTGQIILLTKQMTGQDLDLTMPRKQTSRR